MPKMTYDFFDEEEPFTADNLKQRFDSLQNGINNFEPPSACEKGCLNEEHLPTFMTTSITMEIPAANKAESAQVQDCGYDAQSNNATGSFAGDSCPRPQLS